MASSCSWWHSHHCACLVLWTFYLFRLFISRASRTFLLYKIWHYSGCSRVNLVELFMALFDVFSGARWLPVTFYAVLLVFNATCQDLYLSLHEQSNWRTPRWLLDSSFGLFWHRMLCKFFPDVKVMSLFTFLNSFLIFGPILGIHGIFFLLVSLWLRLFLFWVL